MDSRQFFGEPMNLGALMPDYKLLPGPMDVDRRVWQNYGIHPYIEQERLETLNRELRKTHFGGHHLAKTPIPVRYTNY